ncbi:MAG: winged helix-turn-helix transcriptional regulator [Planctomycetota bacterium]
MESDGSTRPQSVYAIFESCLGCKWTLHVLDQLRAGVNRPGALERTAEGLSTKVLNERLRKICGLGLAERQAFPEVPPRVEYHLTPFGQEVALLLDRMQTLQARFEAGQAAGFSAGGPELEAR